MQLVTRRATGCAGLAAATRGSARYWTDYHRRIPLIFPSAASYMGRGTAATINALKVMVTSPEMPKHGHEVLMKLASSGGYRGWGPGGTCGAQAVKAE
jgi:hypothetical protein